MNGIELSIFVNLPIKWHVYIYTCFVFYNIYFTITTS